LGRPSGRLCMHYRSLIGAIAVAALLVPVGGARADDAK
jgi:hypothetical protein